MISFQFDCLHVPQQICLDINLIAHQKKRKTIIRRKASMYNSNINIPLRDSDLHLEEMLFR